MSKTAILSVRIVGDAEQFRRSLKSTVTDLDKWESGLKKAASGMTVVAAGAVAFAKSAVESASNLQQSVGAVDAVFKESADQMHAWARKAAESVGLSRNEYNEFATVIGSQLKNMGIPMDEVGAKTNRLIELGADLSSMYGGTTAEAVQALSAAFRGETDPIERYGVSIKRADLNARLAAEGLDELEGEALKQAEAETLLKMITEQTADAHGNFAREADTLAHKQQVATAKFEDAKAKIGEGLLPIVSEAADKFAELAEKLGEHPEAVTKAIGAILGLTGALWIAWGAVKTFQGVKAIMDVASKAWAAFGWAAKAESEAVKTKSALDAAASAWHWIVNAGKAAAAWVGMKIKAIAEFIATAAAAAVHAGRTALAWVAAGLRSAASFVGMVASAAASFIAVSVQAGIHAAATAAAWVAAGIRSGLALVAMAAKTVVLTGATWAMTAAQAALNAVMSMNPIMLVVIAVGALVAALVLAYNKSETFRNIVNRVGQIGKQAFQGIANFVRTVIERIGGLISRAGGIGGVFRRAMSIARTAVNWLIAPLRGVASAISAVVGWIGRIRFPSPPGWMRRFLSATPDLSGVMPPDSVFRFMAPSPGLTAAAAAADGGRFAGRLAGPSASAGPMMEVHVDQSVHIDVDGSGIVDPRAVADAVREAVRTTDRRRGIIPAAGVFA